VGPDDIFREVLLSEKQTETYNHKLKCKPPFPTEGRGFTELLTENTHCPGAYETKLLHCDSLE
jgi:hypothetical protein